MVRFVLQTLTAFVVAGLLAGCFDGPPFPPGEALERPSASPSATATDTPSPEPSDAPLWLSSPEPQPSDSIVPDRVPSIVVVTNDRTVDADVEIEPGGAITIVLTKTSTKPAIVSLKNHGKWSSVVQCTGLNGSEDYRTQTDLLCDSLDATKPVKIEMALSPTVVQFVSESLP